MRRDGHLVLEGKNLNAHTSLVQKFGRKMPLGSPRTRIKYNIKRILREYAGRSELISSSSG
jgi:hypothetical protein